jgi:hypothetical protein
MASSAASGQSETLPAKKSKQNTTLSLNVQTLKKARVLAAQRGTSVTGLITQQIEELVEKNDSYEIAKARALELLRSGFGFEGIEHMTKEEMYDRKKFR